MNEEMPGLDIKHQLENIKIYPALIFFKKVKSPTEMSIEKHVLEKPIGVIDLCRELNIDPATYVAELRADKLDKYYKKS